MIRLPLLLLLTALTLLSAPATASNQSQNLERSKFKPLGEHPQNVDTARLQERIAAAARVAQIYNEFLREIVPFKTLNVATLNSAALSVSKRHAWADCGKNEEGGRFCFDPVAKKTPS